MDGALVSSLGRGVGGSTGGNIRVQKYIVNSKCTGLVPC